MTKNELKYLNSLKQKKFRQQENKFLVEGKKIILEGLNSKYKCDQVIYTSEFLDREPDFIKDVNSLGINTCRVKNDELEKITDTVTPQGAAAVFFYPSLPPAPSSKIIAALENISDPGNAGTIIRNCDWFGIKDVIMLKGCAELYNPKTIRSTMGSLFHLNITEEADLGEVSLMLKKEKYKILCADLDGENLFTFNSPEKCVIFFANEANGPSQQLLKAIDKKITIPKLGNAESLNVASASAVILAQLTK